MRVATYLNTLPRRVGSIRVLLTQGQYRFDEPFPQFRGNPSTSHTNPKRKRGNQLRPLLPDNCPPHVWLPHEQSHSSRRPSHVADRRDRPLKPRLPWRNAPPRLRRLAPPWASLGTPRLRATPASAQKNGGSIPRESNRRVWRLPDFLVILRRRLSPPAR